MSFKIDFVDCWERDKFIPEQDRWLASIESIPGMVVTAPTKEQAFEEVMISLRVQVAHDSGYQLPEVSKKYTTSEEIKTECEYLYHEIKKAEDRLKEIRAACDHKNTVEGNYCWRPGAINRALICSDCGTLIKYLIGF